MAKEYLLDTNAYFNLLKLIFDSSESKVSVEKILEEVNDGKLFISKITRVEIISVLGKYARGNTGGYQKCDCVISDDGKRCENRRYQEPRSPWNRRRVKAWLKLINDTIAGESDKLSIQLLPFSERTVLYAGQIIEHALKHNFASMDAMIAATAQESINDKHEMTVITSDKGLKACLSACSIPYIDIFAKKQ